jgi:hypothetical protein
MNDVLGSCQSMGQPRPSHAESVIIKKIQGLGKNAECFSETRILKTVATTADIRTLPRGYEVSRHGSWASTKPDILNYGQHDLHCVSTNACILQIEWLSLNPLVQICVFDLPCPAAVGICLELVKLSWILEYAEARIRALMLQPLSNQSIFTVVGSVSGNFQHVFTSGHGFPWASGVESIGIRAEQ